MRLADPLGVAAFADGANLGRCWGFFVEDHLPHMRQQRGKEKGRTEARPKVTRGPLTGRPGEAFLQPTPEEFANGPATEIVEATD